MYSEQEYYNGNSKQILRVIGISKIESKRNHWTKNSIDNAEIVKIKVKLVTKVEAVVVTWAIAITIVIRKLIRKIKAKRIQINVILSAPIKV